jgi:hypothetical protein
MIQPIYLQDYRVESKQGNVNYSVVGALPNEMPGVETKQYTWNFVSHMVLNKCTRFIRIKYDFKDTEFQEVITFEDKLMGTVQLGSKVYNAGDIIKYKYNKELLEMEILLLFPLGDKICGIDLSWNIFINDDKCNLSATPNKDLTYGETDKCCENWKFENNILTVSGKKKDHTGYTFTINKDDNGKLDGIKVDMSSVEENTCGNIPSVTINYSS